MKKYEYQIIDSTVQYIQKRLHEMSADGWRVVSHVPSTDHVYSYCVILEREITEDANFVREEYDDLPF